MARHPLEGCREKIDWAERHLNALDVRVRQWVRNHPYSTSHHFYDEANLHILWTEMLDPHPEVAWGVMIGNIAHNLRSALDHLVWQLVLANGREPKDGPGGNQWPIFTTQSSKGFARRVHKSMLQGVAFQDRREILRLQPYKRAHVIPVGSHPLALLADLSNTDKHSVIHTTLWRYQPGAVVVSRFLSNKDVGPITYQEFFFDGRLYNGAVVAVGESVPTGPNPEVDMEANFTVDIAFGNGRPVLSTLENIAGIASNAVELFAPRVEAAHGLPPFDRERAVRRIPTSKGGPVR